MHQFWQGRGGDSARRRRGNRIGGRSAHPFSPSFEALECRALLAVSVTPTFTVNNDWGSGFQAELRLASHESSAITPWRLEFDMPATISSIWNASITSHVGNHYVVAGANWNSTLAAGGTVSFGFVAAPGGSPTEPTNYTLNGMSLGETETPPPQMSIGDVAIDEGDSGQTTATFTVTLSEPSADPVSVVYRTSNGTATAGSDYQATSGTLTFAAGQTTKTIGIAVFGDADFETDETLVVDLSAPVGAVLARSRGTATIRNDDVAPPPEPVGDFEFQVVSDWGSGFTGQVTVHNSGTANLEDWVLQFDFPYAINSIWNAKVKSHSGNHYVVEHMDYNRVIAAGGSVSFGFVASPGSVAGGPTNYALEGDGGTPPVNRAPVAANDAAFGTPGQEVLIDVLANDSDPDGDTISLVAASAAAHGTVAIAGDAIRYTPAAGFTGSDSFTYEIQDSQGATAGATVNVTISEASAWPEQVFAPYVDMALYPIYDLVAAAQESGVRYFTLAFIVADAQNKPAWGGYTEYGLGTDYDANMRAQIAGVRALGGDVIVSFGGAVNQELAEVITDVTQLQAAYQSVIDAYGLTQIDFDIEGAAVGHRDSIDRRNQAIAGLQRDAAAAGRTLGVSYTLPVLPTGLTADGVYVIESAVRYGVNLDIVNIMAMDYGDSAAPNPQGKMGDYAIEAAGSLFAQLRSVYGSTKTDDELWSMVGVTPMIGINDVTSEVFDQQEARELLAFAEAHGIGRIAFWSLNRDRQNANGVLNYVDLMSSSILQDEFEFSEIFNSFTG